jgi:hypothetical protein
MPQYRGLQALPAYKHVLDNLFWFQKDADVNAVQTYRSLRLPRWVQVAWLVVICLFVTRLVIHQYQPKDGFLQMICFGTKFQPRELSEIRYADITRGSVGGYDGQFYAQIALDPLLHRITGTPVLDAPRYRAERPVLPMLSYLLGLGKTTYILQIYAVLNLLFWYILLAGLLGYLKAESMRDYLCISAVMLGYGPLASILRALTDLPAMTFGFFGLTIDGLLGSALIACAILTKPSSLLFAIPHLSTSFSKELRYLYRWAIILLIPAAWMLYIIGRTPPEGNPLTNFDWPGVDVTNQIITYIKSLAQYPVGNHPAMQVLSSAFNLASIFSLLIQVLYFAWHFNFRSTWWWIGTGFSVLFIFLSHAVMVEPVAFVRVLFPLTLAFNLCLRNETRGVYTLYFFPGNVALSWIWLSPLLALFL